jgi:DNA-binding GntR family transcriptional regulator
MSGRVSTEDLATAAEWLEVNEGPEGENEACKRVAKWINREIEKRMIRAGQNAAISALAKKEGVSKTAVRRAIAKTKGDA